MESNTEMANYLGLSGLIFACPFGKTTGCCPFAAIHNMQVENRIDYIESLNNYQVMSLMNRHKKCLSMRETKLYRVGNTVNCNSISLPIPAY